MKKILEFFLGKSRNKQIVDLVGLDRIELSRDLKVQANQAVAQGRWDEAAQLYEKAILANSADASLLVGLGFSHLQAVRPKQALATLLQAIRVLPKDRKSTRLNSSHLVISYAVFCLKKKNRLSRFCRLNVMPTV